MKCLVIAAVFALAVPSHAGLVTFKAVLTANGDETVGYELKEYSGDFPYFELRGSLLNPKPAETKTVTFCLPPQALLGCEIDTTRTHSDSSIWGPTYGQGGPGYGIYIDQINSPGGGESASYVLDKNSGCLTSTVTVRAKRQQRGLYAGHGVIYTRCAIRKPWSNTQIQGPFTLDSSAGYSYIANYTGQIGSAGFPGTATVYPNDNGYKVQLVDKSPANAVITSGMFGSTPSGGTNGPRLWALYDANDIQAMALEVTQGVQNLSNSMPLVAGRRTMVRLHVRSKYPASNIDAQLRAFRQGVELSGSPLSAETTIAVRPTGLDRTVLDHAFLFRIPKAWTLGNVEFRGTANPAGIAEEAVATNNVRTENVVFQIADDAVNTVVPVPLHLHEDGDRSKPLHIYGSDNSTFYPLMKHLLRLHPIADAIEFDCELAPLKPTGHDIFHREWDITDEQHWSHMVARVAEKHFWSGCGFTSSFWAGMVDPTLPGKRALNGISYRRSAVIYMAYEPDKWQVPRGQTYAHEIGHSKGLDHVCSIGNPAGRDFDYPYPDPCLMSMGNPSFFSNGHDGYFMMDVYHDYWGLPAPEIIKPTPPGQINVPSVYPMMSYGAPRWISPYSYCKLLDQEGIPCDRLAIRGGPPSAVPAATRPADDGFRIDGSMVTPLRANAPAWLVVHGTFDLDRHAVDDFTLMRLDQVPSANALGTAQAAQKRFAELVSTPARIAPPVLVLSQYDNAGSRSLLRADLVSALDEETDSDSRLRFFIHLVELAPDAGYFELSYGSQIVATLTPSRSRPLVKLDAFPSARLTAEAIFRWTASDPDGDRLTFSIFYSADGGKHWQLIESDIDGFEYRLRDAVEDGDDPLRLFAGTNNGLFRVMAFDGFHTSTDDLGALLSVPGSPPRVEILQPDGYAVGIGQTVYLTGEAFDREDGPIPSVDARTAAIAKGRDIPLPTLRWTSSIDGFLGFGPEIRTRALSHGIHLISFSATDSDGNTSVARIHLYVGPIQPLVNVALVASATASSTYCSGRPEHCYDARRINDDNRSTALGGQTSWSNDSVSLPQWVQLTWNGFIQTDSIELYTTAGYELQDYDIQSWDGFAWNSVVSIRGNHETHRVHSFLNVVTNRIRVLCLSGPSHQRGYARVNELVVNGATVDIVNP